MRGDEVTEYDCERCGIRVIHCIPQPRESLYCCECRFIESIEDPVNKEMVAKALDKNNPMFQDD